jgi:hypothetical protein
VRIISSLELFLKYKFFDIPIPSLCKDTQILSCVVGLIVCVLYVGSKAKQKLLYVTALDARQEKISVFFILKAQHKNVREKKFLVNLLL